MTSVMTEMLRTVFPAAGCGGAAAGVGAAAAAVGEARGALEEAAAWRRGMLSSDASGCVQQRPRGENSLRSTGSKSGHAAV